MSGSPLESLQRQYAALESFQESLLGLQFFALCPDGRVIPVDKLCEEYEKKPDGLVLRTLEDRLVLVIQAKFPGKETPYWQQAFYLSTGTSSGMPKTWLPFDGILLKGSLSRPPPPRVQTQADREFFARLFSSLPAAKPVSRSPFPSPLRQPPLGLGHLAFGQSTAVKPVAVAAQLKPPKPEKPALTGAPWFSKEGFHNYTLNYMYRRNNNAVNTSNIDTLLHEIYGEIYLPEGSFYKTKYSFDRFGTLSYALASQALGGDYFDGNAGNYFFPSYYRKNGYTAVEEALKTRLNVPSPFQSCWLDIQSSYPIEKPYLVNKYIEDHKAFSFMNAFRQENIFPPGLSFVQMPIKTLGYSLPFYDHQLRLVIETSKIWKRYKKGEMTLEEVRAIFANPRKYAEPILKELRKNYAYADEPEFVFNIVETQAQASHPMRKFLGGRTKRRRGGKRKARATRRRY